MNGFIINLVMIKTYIKNIEMNTPSEIYIQENDTSMHYGIKQDKNIKGMVRYIRSDYVPNAGEMKEFANQMTFHLDDRLEPLSREELRILAFLEGFYFAKRNIENDKFDSDIIAESSD